MATTFKGTAQVAKNLAKLRAFSPDAFAQALYQESLIEEKECKRRCPVDKGPLRASIHVEGPVREGRRVYATIVAGGPSVDYALQVHEDLEAFHANGEAKFIERPLNESAQFMADRIAKRIDLNKAL